MGGDEQAVAGQAASKLAITTQQSTRPAANAPARPLTVVCQGAAVLQLLAGEDEALLVRGDALLVLQGKTACRTRHEPVGKY